LRIREFFAHKIAEFSKKMSARTKRKLSIFVLHRFRFFPKMWKISKKRQFSSKAWLKMFHFLKNQQSIIWVMVIILYNRIFAFL